MLLDKVAIVTGGGLGLGEAISLRLAQEGAHIVIADINLETAQETAARIAARTERKAIALQTNVTDEAQVEAMVERTMDEFGRLDILVNNAGVLRSGAIEEFALKDWRFVIDVNLIGYFLCCKYATRVMKEQGSGTIIQINSKSGKKGS
ncbi:MAG TPA: SDR family NAD(P)-dependent oxidoreductase, partial [Anaerolineae bacterium]|nr:SDR family NAD(P)-dependent oxidoreductase [Anaerolineae bacterium]